MKRREKSKLMRMIIQRLNVYRVTKERCEQGKKDRRKMRS